MLLTRLHNKFSRIPSEAKLRWISIRIKTTAEPNWIREIRPSDPIDEILPELNRGWFQKGEMHTRVPLISQAHLTTVKFQRTLTIPRQRSGVSL
jgi:hypothetical protein